MALPPLERPVFAGIPAVPYQGRRLAPATVGDCPQKESAIGQAQAS